MDINQMQNLYHGPNVPQVHCFVVNITAERGIWQSENPLSQALPLLAMQLATGIFVTRTLFYLLRPFYIPQIATDILGGILLGPTALGNMRFFSYMFPLRSVLVEETVAYWALTCHVFLVGLETDIASIFRARNKTINIAIAGIVLPFILGIGLFFFTNVTTNAHYKGTGCFYWALSLTVTGFPVVARVLSDLKLLHTDIGRMAMSTSLVNDLIVWILLAILIPIQLSVLNALLAVATTLCFVAFCIHVVHPFLSHIIRKTSKSNNYSEYYLSFVLVAVSLFACVSEFLGTNSIIGGFIFGLIMPKKELASVLINKFEDFVSAYLLPLFFVACGIRINIWSISDWGIALIVVFFACAIKIVSTIIAFQFYSMPPGEGLPLGVVLNTKGILAIIILNMGYDREFLTSQDYAIMVLAVLIMTGAVSPVISVIYRPAKFLSQYKRRTIQKARQEADLRILTCLHNFCNVAGMINLLDSSNGSKQSPLSIFSLHLIELTGRASAMVIVHNPNKASSRNYLKNSQSEQIISALDTYQNLNEGVTVQCLTALSPFDTMHEDICSLAEDKEIAFLILPFHKLPTQEGKLEEEGSASFRGVNLNVLMNAPCTVGIFVDRGFGLNLQGESNLKMRQIAMLFIGGPDDREALAFAWRMAGTHGIGLIVVRFLPGDKVEDIEPTGLPASDAQRLLTSYSYVDRQRRIDDEHVNEFRLKTAGESHVSYEERVVNNDEETILALKEMHHVYDLYVVGKGEGIISPLTAGLLEWCEFPELGALGDLLVTSSFAQGSVLVVQQYSGSGDRNLADVLASQEADDSGHGNWRSAMMVEEEEDGVFETRAFTKHQVNGDFDV